MNRRDAIEQLAVLAAAGLSRKALWTPARAVETPPVTAGLVAAREQIMAAFAGSYTTGDAQDLLPAAAAFGDSLAPLLKRAPTHELGLRLAAVGVDAHSMAGVMAFHVGDPVLTHRHFGLAGYIADASMDPLLRARAWTMSAKYVHSPIVDGHGSPRQAVALLGRARALARHADGHTRAWIAAGFAQESAETGDVGLCQWAVDDAWRALDSATGHGGGLFSPDGLYGQVEIYLRGVTGRVAGLAGRLDEAERAIGEEITRAQNARQRIWGLCTLGKVRVWNAQPEGACAAVGEAVDLARGTGNVAKVTQARAIRLTMDPTWDTLDCVIDLDERLRTAA